MTMLRNERGRTGSELWIKWVIACSVGVAAGEAIGSVVPETSVLLGGLHSAAIGAMLGIMQWLVLRSRVEQVGWWPVASSVSLGGGLALGLAASFAAGWEVVQPLAIPLGAAVLSFTQWLILRRSIGRAGWWIAANVVALTIAFIAALLITFSLGFDFESSPPLFRLVSLTFFGAVTGALMGLFTGPVLVWLLRQHVTAPPAELLAESAR